MASSWSYFMFLLWLAYLVLSGIIMFTRGFLLTRVSQKETTHCQPYTDIPCGPLEASNVRITNGHEFHCTQDDRLLSLLQDVNASTKTCLPKRAKVILFVIDALKYEFAEYNDSLVEPLAYQNKLPVLAELMKEAPGRTRLYKFLADPPTTTLQRLKGMTTGSLPTFIDAGSNFATPEINEDNVIDQLVTRGGKAVLLGDDTWASLYPKRWVRSLAMPSFNTWDLDTVDNAIKGRLPEELARTDWSLMVAHFLGVDHCGHRHGPLHTEMGRKLTEMDAAIRSVVQAMDNETMLFVMGDHGMTLTGDHGGETDAEVTAAMFVYSPFNLLSPPEPLSPKTVRQVDLVPTLSAILGIPPPHSNLGALILDALPFPGMHRPPFQDWQFALLNLWANVKQVKKYIQQYSMTSDQFTSDKMEDIDKKFSLLSHRVQTVYNERAFHSFATDAREFLIDVRSMCQEVWIQFDSFSMSRGLLLTFLTIFYCYMIVDGIPAERLPEIFQSSFLWCSYAAMGLAALASVACHHFMLVDNLELTILFSTGMVSVFMLAMLVIQNWELISLHWYANAKKRNWLDCAARAILALSACALFSNSYVVEEGTVLSFLFLSLLLLACYSGNLPKVLMPLFIGVALVICASRYYRICREEQGECYFKVGDATQTTPLNMVVGLVSLALLVSISRLWLRSCGNLVSPDTMLWRYAPTVAAVCTGGHWVASWGQHKAPWRADSLAKVVYGIISVTIIVLFIKPLGVFLIPRFGDSVSVNSYDSVVPQLFNQMKGLLGRQATARKAEAGQDVPVVCGLATVYSAAFVALSVPAALLVALLLGAAAAPTAALLYAAGAMTLIILAIVRYQNSTTLAQLLNVDACGVMCWTLLSLYFFYGSGHQAALASIHWGAAFVGTGGHFLHNAVPAVLVTINTFGSHILTGLCVPLLVLAPLPLQVMWAPGGPGVDVQRGELLLYERQPMLMAAMFNVSAKYILFHSVRMFVCMLAATVHCRHLMVWKVFAPKLIFEALGLAVTLGSVLLTFLLLLRVNSRLAVFLERVLKSS